LHGGTAKKAIDEAIMRVLSTTAITTTTTARMRNAAISIPIAFQIPTPNAIRTAITPVTNVQSAPTVASSGPTTGIGVRNDASVGE
jgi:hypothetical protein